jgi:oligopeptide transport system substrate-binding protein
MDTMPSSLEKLHVAQRFLQIFMIIYLMVHISCAPEGRQNAANAGKTVFRYNQPNPVTSLDPAFAKSQNNIWACGHLYDGLVQLDDSLRVRPSVAKSWEISADGLRYTFHLRNDARFHDDEAFGNGQGRLVNAKDVAYSFGRILDEALGSPGSWVFKGKVAEESPFVALDDSTFQLRLAAPFRPMLGILTMPYCFIVPEEAVSHYGDGFGRHPVGTGAFMFKKWVDNQALYFRKNPNYWELDVNGQKLPYLDAVKVSFIGDRKTAYLEFSKQKLDYMSGLDASVVDELLTPDGALRPEKLDAFRFQKVPFLNMEYLGVQLQMDGNPLKNKKLRQALNYGIDRQLMLKTLRNGVGKAATSGFTPIGLPSFSQQDVSGYSYDPARARRLLAEAGHPNGHGLPEIKLQANEAYLDICNFLVRQWQELGLRATVEVVEAASLRERMTKGEAAFFRASWIGDYPDAENFFAVFYSKNPAPPNYTHFSNARFDALYEASLLENDDEKRYALYHQMDKILVEECPVVFLFYDETAVFIQKNIRGLAINPINSLNLKRVSKVAAK